MHPSTCNKHNIITSFFLQTKINYTMIQNILGWIFKLVGLRQSIRVLCHIAFFKPFVDDSSEPVEELLVFAGGEPVFVFLNASIVPTSPKTDIVP